MVRWGQGEASVRSMIEAGDLQQVSGGAANGESLLTRASTTLESARSVLENDPDSAFVLAYDAARHALTALLTHQGSEADDPRRPIRCRARGEISVRPRLPSVRCSAAST